MFEQRYFFTGQLVLETALHIGGGRGTLLATDSPVVRTATDDPFIPGSSMKGAFRSTVEKLAGSVLGVRACALTDGAGCPGAQGDEQQALHQSRRGWTEQRLLSHLEHALCDTCWLFGSPFRSSRLLFSDLYLQRAGDAVTQVRDGVGIDRDSERAVDQIKYDFEVVDPGASFDFQLLLDDPTRRDLALTCLGLCEYVTGFGGIGGKRSRGLGACRLVGLRVHYLDLTDSKTRWSNLRRYLLGANAPTTATLADRLEAVPDVDGFLTAQIDALLTAKGA